MNQLRENFDLVAIVVLATVLGVAGITRLPHRFIDVEWEHDEPRIRMLRVDHAAHSIPFAR